MRPYKELRGFERLTLQPGESREVVFTLDADLMGYYEPYDLTWTLEPGEVEVMIGCNSRDTQMKLLKIAMTDEAAKVVEFHRVDDMILLKQSGNLLIATGGGLLIFDHETQMLRTLKGGHTNMPISVLKETHDGRVLVGSDSYGIWRMEADETLHTLNVYDPNTNLTFAKVKAIEEDAEGNLLFGLLQKGVMVMTRQPDNFAYYAISPTTNKINAVAVTSLSYDPKVGYIVSTDGCGVFRCSSSNLSESQQISGGLKSSLVQSTIIDRDGHVWVGTYGGGVQCLSGDVFITPSWLNSISNAYVMSLSYDAKTNTIYAGTNVVLKMLAI